MADSWKQSLLFNIFLIGVAAAVGAWIPVRLLVALLFIATVGFRMRSLDTGHVQPWMILAGGAASSVAGAIGRTLHGVAVGVEYPFPSPADALTVLGYVLTILAIVIFGQLRSEKSDPSASFDSSIDAVIFAIAAAILMFGLLLPGYLGDSLVPQSERVLNGFYAGLTVLLFGATVRLAIGPGRRSPSFWFLLFASISLVTTDVLLLADANATAAASIAAILAMGFGTASVLHPKVTELCEPIQGVEARLRGSRIVVQATSLLVVPLAVGLNEMFEIDTDLLIVSAGAVLLTVVSVYRLTRLFRANEQLATAVAVQSSEHRFRRLTQASAEVIMLVDSDDHVSFVTSNCDQVLEFGESHYLGKPLGTTLNGPGARRVDELIERARTTRNQMLDELSLVSEGDSWWARVSVDDHSHDPEVGGVVITFSDVTVRRNAEQRVLRSEARFRSLVQHSSDIVAIIDEDEFVTYVSPAVERVLGYQPSELLGTKVVDVLSLDAVRDTSDLRDRLLSGETVERESIDIRTTAKDGSWRYLNVTVTDMTSDPAIAGIVLNVRDDTERLSLERNLRFQASHDSLTALANRSQLLDSLGDVLADTTRTDEMVGVMLLNLDDFKLVNDALGHAAGDQVLVEISDRLRTSIRISDSVARFGADEFAVLMTSFYAEHEAIELAERVLESIGYAMPTKGRSLKLSASIGIAYDTDRSTSAEDLVKQADVAMYAAKDKGKGQVEVFAEEMLSQAGARLDLIEALRVAIEDEDLEVHYQPLVDLQTERINGFEALVRWNRPGKGLVGPAGFIGVAEDTGLISALGLLVLRDAAKQLAEWISAGHDLYVSVNVSARQLQEETIVDDLTKCVANSGLEPQRVVLEITESVFARDKELIAERLRSLRANGFRIAIDDFGTGYSSLQYLQQFEFDILKIDKSFVDRIETGEDDGVIETVISLAAKSRAITVAEGIESAGQARALRSMGCEVGQGYYYARPMPAEKTANALASEPLPLSAADNQPIRMSSKAISPKAA